MKRHRKRLLLVGAVLVLGAVALAVAPGPLGGNYRLAPVCGEPSYFSIRDGHLLSLISCDGTGTDWGEIVKVDGTATVYTGGDTIELRPRMLFLDVTWKSGDGSLYEDRHWRCWMPFFGQPEYEISRIPDPK